MYIVLRLPQLLVEMWVTIHGHSQSTSSQPLIITVGSQLGGASSNAIMDS